MDITELTELVRETATLIDETGFKEWLTVYLLPKIAHLPKREQQDIIKKAEEIHKTVHQNLGIQDVASFYIERNAQNS